VAKVDKNDYKSEIIQVIASLRNIYGLSEQEVVEFFEMLVPEYKIAKKNGNGNSQVNAKPVAKENKN
jgi:hypothetical protein